MRERTRTRWIGLLLFASIASSIGLIVAYSTGGHPQIEGMLLGVSLGSIGVSLIAWAHGFLPGGRDVQDRGPYGPVPAEEEAAIETAEKGAGLITRRTFLFRMLVGALGSLAAAAVLPIRSLAGPRGNELVETPFARGVRLVDEDGAFIRPAGVPVGGVVTAFPETAPKAADAVALLIGMGTAYRPVPGRDGWDVDGIVAYSKLCTHLGCPVGLYDPSTRHLVCPCHQSEFDMVDGGAPAGGPATRSLPQLPLDVTTDGYLVATGDYSAPTGPGFWRLPSVE
jgi:ubiquinol-cytochrome c reductase iron-sulfur subunit